MLLKPKTDRCEKEGEEKEEEKTSNREENRIVVYGRGPSDGIQSK